MATPSETKAVSLLKDLMGFNSTTGQEKQCAEFLLKSMKENGLQGVFQYIDEQGQRPNVLAYLPSSPNEGRSPKVLLCSHIDTVPPYIPFSEDDKCIYGRGSCDAKGSVAAQIRAVLELKEEGKLEPGDVGMLYVVGEETDHVGIIKANELDLSCQYFVVGEPTDSRLAKGHKGMLRFTIEVDGKPAHSGYPEQGCSAIDALLDILYRLQNAEWPVDPILGPTTLNIGQLSGGAAANIIAEFARAEIAMRISIPDVNSVVNQVKSIIEAPRSSAHAAPNAKVSWRSLPPHAPVPCSVVELEGVPTFVAAYFTDIPFLKGSHQSILIGPGSILVAHGHGEFVSKSELVQHVGIYKRLILKLLNKE
ncbi:hypothetical protein HK102_013344 [Quaeritorhiza haematococci]|nr:hypothetical protein HK102_013344 [Quaeritorhiza haematococci]